MSGKLEPTEWGKKLVAGREFDERLRRIFEVADFETACVMTALALLSDENGNVTISQEDNSFVDFVNEQGLLLQQRVIQALAGDRN